MYKTRDLAIRRDVHGICLRKRDGAARLSGEG